MMRLKEEIRINKMTLANRLVMPPMATYISRDDDSVADSTLEYYRKRAEGGYFGLIITEHTYVDMQGKAGTQQLSMAEDFDLEGMKKLVAVCKSGGAKVVSQLNHAGSATNPTITGQPIVSASAVVNPSRAENLYTEDMPAALTTEEIHALEDKYVRAALRAVAAGYDGVEIHSAHGYLLNQFYSPLTNHRHDEYGCDSVENRVRMHCEILKKVRAAVGPDYPVFIRLGGADYLEGGSSFEDAAAACKLFQEAGADCLDLSGGMCRYTRPDGVREAGYFSEIAEAVMKIAKVPVILTGGVREAAQAEMLLEKGLADMIGVGRAVFKDADWARKQFGE